MGYALPHVTLLRLCMGDSIKALALVSPMASFCLCSDLLTSELLPLLTL